VGSFFEKGFPVRQKTLNKFVCMEDTLRSVAESKISARERKFKLKKRMIVESIMRFFYSEKVAGIINVVGEPLCLHQSSSLSSSSSIASNSLFISVILK
jgi:hypothetical protein